ncbi:non-ribosomal peptide synthetase [Sphingomonas sp.]|uniref:non-ribosomal peptide synthetase n=1 Tax=Sphingomonas sp. TaxID=28214 RepID=UPI001DCAFAF7|nr:non-ribosomal peptide synthetase [Sphingomonas sp.]MBX9796794.1 amino acid adenylation domain-containing protein [Sphingomonas sp.]
MLHELLIEPAARDSEAIAIEIPPGPGRAERQTLSYAALVALSDRLALHIVPLIEAESIVPLLLPRTSPMIFVAQLAVLKAGGAYTSIDPSFPDERISEIVADAAPRCLLSDAAGLARLQGLQGDGLILLDVDALPDREPPEGAALPAAISPEQLAYVIYTSGTTGRPKGVMIEHRSIANLIAANVQEFGLTPLDRVVQSSSPAYDSSLEETWLAFSSGATLVVMDDAAARLGPDAVTWLQAERATVLCPTPTLLRSSGCVEPQAALPALRLLYVGGEALPRDVADAWAPGRRLVNGYGPTETSVVCLRGDVRAGEPITIGKPVPGMQAWVLDEALNPVAEGEQGELCVGGVGVARGYRNRPELTTEKFVEHPMFGRLYRTGDLVHRDASGDYHYHGRIDAQVKIRGYRVELGEIEARLAASPDVRAAAARLQDNGGVPELVAYVVPADPAVPVDLNRIRASLAGALPSYMVPRQIGTLPELPTTVGGKLNRAALPPLVLADQPQMGTMVGPATPLEQALAAAVADILKRPDGVSVEHDFFEDLGGDSLSAALLVTLCREEASTSWITVSDIYEARTVRALAKIGAAAQPAVSSAAASLERNGIAKPFLANVVQMSWLAGELMIGAWAGWAVAFKLIPSLLDGLDLVAFILLAPSLLLAGIAIYVPASVGFAVLVKRLLIGRYRPLRAPVWSPYYLRHWCVTQAVRLIPWSLLGGTAFQSMVLRALGARIGRRVHIHRGVDLMRGGWDLLDIGDDVALGQDAHVGLVELDRGDIVVGAITIEAGATLLVRASVEGGCHIGAGSVLAPLSVLNAGGTIPPGEYWDGVPAQRIGLAPAAPVASGGGALTPWQYGMALMAAEALMVQLVSLPIEIMALGACWLAGISADDLWRWTEQPVFDAQMLGMVIALAAASVPLSVVWSALIVRSLGRVQPGVISRWSLAYIRVWLKTGLVHAAGEWLSGALFWPLWLRAAGMRIGRKCEISTIIDVVPELVTIGEETFFADGIYLGGPEVSQGTVRLAPLTLGRNTFLGNHAVVPAGQTLPEDILIGIATVADATKITAGQSRFGHPSFDLPRRQIVEVDRSLTHDPSAIRLANRLFWETLRFAIPIFPVLLSIGWFWLLESGAERASPVVFALLVIPGITVLPLALLCLAVAVLKWGLLGRVKPGQHALYSCWASRWDFVFVAWAKWGAPVLQQLEGTFLQIAYLRLMGVRLGRNVVLGPQFAQVVDPDMIEIGDGATVSAMYQAHTFEDRVLKIDKVRVLEGATLSAGTVPLYGALVGARAHVGANSVIMKQEHLSPGLSYQGVPVRIVG